MEQANAFLRTHYSTEFNRRLPNLRKGREQRFKSAVARIWICTVQTERVVGQDDCVVLQNRWLQLDKTRFRNTLAGCTVTL